MFPFKKVLANRLVDELNFSTLPRRILRHLVPIVAQNDCVCGGFTSTAQLWLASGVTSDLCGHQARYPVLENRAPNIYELRNRGETSVPTQLSKKAGLN